MIELEENCNSYILIDEDVQFAILRLNLFLRVGDALAIGYVH